MRSLIATSVFLLLCCGCSQKPIAPRMSQFKIEEIGIQVSYPQNWLADTVSYELKSGGQVLTNWLSLQNWRKTDGSPYLETGQVIVSVMSSNTPLALTEWLDQHERMNLKNIDALIQARNEDLEKQQSRHDFVVAESDSVLQNGMKTKILFVKDPGGIEGGPVTLKKYFFKHRSNVIILSATTATSDSSDYLISQLDNIVAGTGFF